MRAPHRIGSLDAPSAAAIAYLAAWVIGLATWPSNLAVDSSNRAVVDAYTAHRLPATVQFLLVEGLAALALGVIVLAIARVSRPRAPLASRIVLLAGGLACSISLVQCVTGVALAAAVASPAHLGAAGTMFDLIDRLDGVKMMALATMIAAVTAVHRDLGLARWLAAVGALAGLALVCSGSGYLALDPGWAMAASASLPLLLAWALGVGFRVRREERGSESSRIRSQPSMGAQVRPGRW